MYKIIAARQVASLVATSLLAQTSNFATILGVERSSIKL